VNSNSHSNIRFESKSLHKKTDLKALNEKNQINPTSKSNIQTQLEKVIKYLKRNGGKATRFQILSSRILKGGVGEYDVILSLLEKHSKIIADRKQDSKKSWVYSLV
jgi:hypothetical protein